MAKKPRRPPEPVTRAYSNGRDVEQLAIRLCIMVRVDVHVSEDGTAIAEVTAPQHVHETLLGNGCRALPEALAGVGGSETTAD